MLRSSMVGEVLGNYRVVEALDSGGMGSVYKAEHIHLARPAAIKLLHPELSSNDEIVQRFFNEAKAATAIRHPGIVEVYDFGYTADGRAYFAMELLEGQQLGRRLEEVGGRLSELEAARIAKSLATVLKAAHAKGIVHRDLKPDNIFLIPDDDDGDRVKILDFGVAKLAEAFPAETRHTQTGALMGTPLYMAPEQARAAAAIDHRADLYSLGCILYELLAGKPPFLAEGAGEIIALQMFSPVQPLRERLASVSPEIEEIVMKLLEKEPADRYQTAGEVAAALGAAMAKLSGRMSAELEGANASSPRFTYTPGSKQLTVTAKPIRSLADERPTEIAPAKKSSMPLVAGIVTVLLAGGAAIFALARSSEDDKVAPVVETRDSSGSAPVTATPPPAPVPAKPVVEAVTPAVAPVIAPTPSKPPRKKPAEVPAGAPVTRPDVEPLNEPEEIRTPITKKPLETDLDETKPESE